MPVVLQSKPAKAFWPFKDFIKAQVIVNTCKVCRNEGAVGRYFSSDEGTCLVTLFLYCP